MSGAKMGILASYLALALVAVLVSGQAASYAMWVLGILALAHLVEVVVFYRRCQQAPGSLAAHLLNVFLFGIFHIKELDKAAQ
mgnify:CR=1 FL=1